MELLSRIENMANLIRAMEEGSTSVPEETELFPDGRATIDFLDAKPTNVASAAQASRRAENTVDQLC